MSGQFKLTLYSHFFKVTGYDTNGYRAIKEFCRKYLTQYGMVPVGYNRFERKPVRVYAAANRERTEYRFHINQLEEFKRYLMSTHHVQEKDFVMDYVPIPAAKSVTFNLDSSLKLYDNQIPVYQYMIDTGKIKAVILQTGSGKAQPLDALIKTPTGWTTIGSLKVGDPVIAKDGSTTKVTGVFPQGAKMIYRVVFGDGRTAECCIDHLWKIYRPNRVWDSKIVDTREMIRLKTLANDRLYIDLIDPEEGVDIVLPMAPYTLGALLANGSFRNGHVNISTDDVFVIDKLKTELPENMTIQYIDKYDYKLVGAGKGKPNHYLNVIRELGLAEKYSYEKFIPDIYLLGSKHQRLELLRGLLDGDGTVSNNSSSIHYYTTSPQLAKGVQYLVRSIGGVCKIKYKHEPKYTYNGENRIGRRCYILNVRVKRQSELFSLPRKLERTNDNNQYAAGLKLRVDSIEPVGYKPCQCISIDHPEKLYVTNDFVVTHNTILALMAVNTIAKRVILVIKPMYIERWVGDLTTKLGLTPEELVVVQGSKHLKLLIQAARMDILEAKFIIISNRTYYNFLDTYEQFGDTTDMYGCNPEDLCGLLGGGLRAVDEVHQDFHFNFRMDLYTNIEKTLALTATFKSDNSFVNKMYELAYPPGIRFAGQAYRKYILAKALFYAIDKPEQIRCTSRMRTYSHIEFEKSIMRRKGLLKRYMDMIADITFQSFVTDMRPGQKMLIFCASIDLCTELQRDLQNRFSDLIIGRYVEEDKYEDLLTSDITVSTVLSAGTAVDIPGLRTVLMTTVIGSSQANEQAIGRLRELKQWPDVTPTFLYLVCESIYKHIEYHQKKRKTFDGKVLSHQDMALGVRI